MTREIYDGPEPAPRPLRPWAQYLLLAVLGVITATALALLSLTAPPEPVPTPTVSSEAPDPTVIPGGVR